MKTRSTQLNSTERSLVAKGLETKQPTKSKRDAATKLANELSAGRVYRRRDLLLLSPAVDRHLRELLAGGCLAKLAWGIYYKPRCSRFGLLPPEDEELVAAFLCDKPFLLLSPSAYNSAGLGATQLYNCTLVYNHKRNGVIKLGNRVFDFRKRKRFPENISPEFLFVDALNNLDALAEDRAALLARAPGRAASFDRQLLLQAVDDYGSIATKKLLKAWLAA